MAKESRADLIKQAEAKWERDQLIAAAEAKWAEENKAAVGSPEEAALRGALSSASLGITEPIIAGARSLIGTGIQAVQSQDDIPFMEELKKNYKVEIARKAGLERDHPVASTLGTIAGAFSPVGPAAALARGAGALGKSIGAGLPLVGKIAPNVLGSAGQGAAIAGATAGAEEAVRELSGLEQEGLSNPGGAAALGAGLGGGMALAGKIPAAIKGAAQIGMKTFLGVSPEVASEYLARRPELQKAKTFEDVAQMVHSEIANIAEDLSGARMRDVEAKALIKDLEGQLKAWQQAVGGQVADEAKELKSLTQYAQQKLDLAARAKELDLRRMAEVSREAPMEYVEATQGLKQKVIEGKRAALELLEKSKQFIELDPIRKAISDAQNGLKIKGQAIGPAKDVIRGLEQLKREMAPLGSEISALDARRFVDLLDDQINYVESAVGFSDPLSQRLQRVRGVLNEKVGDQVPEFANAMKGVAENAKLLHEAMDLFKTESKATSTLKQLDKNARAIETIKKIGQVTGAQIAETAESMIVARAQLKDKAGLIEGLPEFSELRQLQIKLNQYAEPALEAQARLNKNPEVSQLYQQIEKAKMEQLVAQEALSTAEKKAASIRGLSPRGVEGSLKTYMGNRSIEVEQLFKRLSEATNQNFEAIVKDMATMERFNAGYQHGSRNVNIWGVLASGAAGSVGLGPLIGGPIGVTIGALIDRYGPAMGKKILDQVAGVAAMPTVQKINQMRLPEPVKEELKRDFFRFVGSMEAQKVEVSEDRKPAVAIAIRDSKLGAIKKAKMLSELIDEGTLSDPKALMLGEEAKKPSPYEQKKTLQKTTDDYSSFRRKAEY